MIHILIKDDTIEIMTTNTEIMISSFFIAIKLAITYFAAHPT